jgi:hypothetical protein
MKNHFDRKRRCQPTVASVELTNEVIEQVLRPQMDTAAAPAANASEVVVDPTVAFF